ncbi:MAG: Serine--tRNA ligase, mitochondrial [Peltula sp. TS41687]|nr:MAG: Serine--tRNA ligase, mitochondrial [Peltula sp. TS41687]
MVRFTRTLYARRLGSGTRLSRPFTSSPSRLHQEQPDRPSIAPKASVDIKHIRQHLDLHTKNCADRNFRAHVDTPDKIIGLFDEWQSLQKGARGLRERNNELQRQMANIGPCDAAGDMSVGTSGAKQSMLQEARDIKRQLQEFDTLEKLLYSKLTDLAMQLPNLTSKETPIGEEPRLVGYINEDVKKQLVSSDRSWRSHVDIGKELQLLDFSAAAATSGWGWYFLMNEAAMLEQALVQYALNVAMSKGWTVVAPPSVVYSHIASACGFRPRDQNGEQQIYTLEQSSKGRQKPELCLAGTAEIPLAGMKSNRTLEEHDLPIKTVGVSRCYRAEAGARGVETKGLYRVHEFIKVEMFAWTMPDDSEDHDASSGVRTTRSPSETIFHEMLTIQSEILELLGLHCRVLEMPSADLGASATRKRDIEVFFPSRRDKNGGWGEVTSTSICSDYQSRRLATTLRTRRFARQLQWPYTVNGTAMAVPRVLAAVLENGWDEKDGVVHIPKVLRPWMAGLDVIRKRRTG